MNILLGFAPFFTFALLSKAAGALPGLLAGAAVSAALIVRARAAGKAAKVLEIGTLVLFLAIAGWVVLRHAAPSMAAVRLAVDGGLLLIVLLSLVAGRPFTLQYAREQVAPALWTNPVFLHANRAITAAWALAFFVNVLADLSFVFLPGVPRALGGGLIVAGFGGAAAFTSWYPKHLRRRAGLEPSFRRRSRP